MIYGWNYSALLRRRSFHKLDGTCFFFPFTFMKDKNRHSLFCRSYFFDQSPQRINIYKKSLFHSLQQNATELSGGKNIRKIL